MTNMYGFYSLIEMNNNFPVPTRWEVFQILLDIPDFETIIVSLAKRRNPRAPDTLLKRFCVFVKSSNILSTRAVIQYTLDKYFSSKHRDIKRKRLNYNKIK
jgi:hypothetical protein